MARTTAQVDGDRLVLLAKDENPIIVGTPEWFAWLESATTFEFTSSFGSFTARKEPRSRGGWYWKAYYRLHGILHRAYLGKTADLTLDRLNNTAASLAAAVLKSPSTRVPLSAPTSSLPANLRATKLIVPPARAQLVVRSRLFKQLEAGLQGKLTLIAAPAGFGKTTLVSAWRTTARGSALPFAWVSLDPGDNDPLLFWSYLLTALDRVAPGVSTSALTLLQSPQPPPIEHLLTSMLNAFTDLLAGKPGRDIILVLEDYHLITNPAIHLSLSWLLDCLPPGLHLVIITRADPPLPLARMRVNGDLTELHAADLRFTPEEAAAFLNQIMGLALTSDDLVALERRTEGWIAGLQLAALALRDHSDRPGFIRTFSGNNRYIVDYLATEVFERQSVRVQTFLLYTSILGRMCGSLCDLLLGLDPGSAEGRPVAPQSATILPTLAEPTSFGEPLSSQSILEELERANLFVIPLDNERHWYRYHHLFAEVLQQRLARSATRASVTGLHERASRWYEQEGLVAEAVQHGLLMPDGKQAAQLIEQHGLSTIVGGQVQTVLVWLSRLPQDLLHTRSRLGIVHSLALLFTGDLEAAKIRLEETESCVNSHTPADEARITQGQAAAIRANLAVYNGDLAACAVYAEQVLRWLPQTEVIARTMAQVHLARSFRVTGDVTVASEQRVIAAIAPVRAAGNLLGTMAAVINLARLQELQGRLHAAATTYHELVQLATGLDELRGLHGSLPYYAGLGNLYREWNELEVAEEYLSQAMALQPGTGTKDAEYVSLSYLALARLQHLRGEHTKAQETLATFIELARRRGFVSHLVTRAAAVQAQFALATGNLSAAVRWVKASGLQADDEVPFPREEEYLILARVWIAQAGNAADREFLQQALHLLNRLMADASSKARQASVLEILVVQALAFWAEGNSPAALASLVQALELAAPEGYVRCFVEEGSAMRGMLKAVENSATSKVPDYVSLLLAAFTAEGEGAQGTTAGAVPADYAHGKFKLSLPQQPSSSSTSHPLLQEPLTEREREVLRLIASGQSNAEVARTLVIALSTVKTHTNSIFSKLGVTSRTQALARARELQIL